MDIDKILNANIDNNYKLFQQKICCTKYPILGIKIPLLRKIATNLLKKYNYQDILNNLTNNSYEEVMLKGLIIANCSIDYEKKLTLIKNFLPLIDNWAICDIFVGELKFIKNNTAKFLKFLKPLFNSKKEYTLRFAIVSLLNYYINDEYIDLVLNKCLEIKSDYYYVKMAISWTLSISFTKYFAKTLKFMQDHQNEFDKWTYNKALQKAKESLQIDNEKKIILQKAKIK